MSKLTLIGTFYRKHYNSLYLVKRVFVDSIVKPDETFFMCEEVDDVAAITDGIRTLIELEIMDDYPEGLDIRLCPTPRTDNGAYEVIPYSRKINEALDLSTGDLICYLDNDSMPYEQKYAEMKWALDMNFSYGAVYCGQKRTGMHEISLPAEKPVEDAYCGLNYTQVMHRKTDDRWPLDMQHANPDLADGIFWRKLHQSIGTFYPVAIGRVLDEHHIPNAAAQGC